MIASATIATVISTYGIAILAPLAVIEGPIVTVVAAYLASISLLNLTAVIVCVIVADIVGDCLLYGLGRGLLDWVPDRIRTRLGVSPPRLAQMVQTFREKGVRVLILAKLTHAAGLPVLIAAGAARMPFVPFVLANLAATIPKSLALVALGYLFGSAHALIGEWISLGSVLILAVFAVVLLALRYRNRKPVA